MTLKAHVSDRSGRSLGLVSLSSNTDPRGKREEQVMFGRMALEDVMKALEPEYDSPQARMLTAARFVSNAVRDSKTRDEVLEGDIVVAFLRHNGTGALL